MTTYKGFTVEVLKTYLNYNPTTGIFTWTNNIPQAHLAGKSAGCVNGGGYIQIRLFGVQLLGHHVAWFIMTGELADRIDHRDRVTINNSWNNLRKCTESENQCNRKFRKNNSGYKNIYILKSTNPGKQLYYNCRVMKNGKSYRATFSFTPEGLEKAKNFVSSIRNSLHGDYACE